MAAAMKDWGRLEKVTQETHTQRSKRQKYPMSAKFHREGIGTPRSPKDDFFSAQGMKETTNWSSGLVSKTNTGCFLVSVDTAEFCCSHPCCTCVGDTTKRGDWAIRCSNTVPEERDTSGGGGGEDEEVMARWESAGMEDRRMDS